ncbi:MAG: flagellar biosynthesis protein FliQ [Bdellovibrionota bacterium]|nr:flagellar biosynthesis protein FliQ [Bdellovibrio sp.]
MDFDNVIEITNQGMKIGLLVAAPMLLGALLTGVLVSLFQAVTQINEQALAFIPKILIVGGAIVIFGPWMSDTLTSYTHDLITNIPNFIQGR